MFFCNCLNRLSCGMESGSLSVLEKIKNRLVASCSVKQNMVLNVTVGFSWIVNHLRFFLTISSRVSFKTRVQDFQSNIFDDLSNTLLITGINHSGSLWLFYNSSI